MPNKIPKAALLTMLLFFNLSAHAQTDMTMKVKELLQIDAEIALKNERSRMAEVMGRKSSGDTAASPENSTSSTGNTKEDEQATSYEITGIFGLGEKLFADVLVNGVRHRFTQGRKAPLQPANGSDIALIEITPPCAVVLIDGQDEELCIER